MDRILELNLGGTAVGTGLNADPRYVQLAVENLERYTGFKFRVARNFAALMQSMADFINLSGALRTLSLDLTKIANDVRLLSSGPTTGIGEIILPAVQPGSSIMPGKVNPSIAEMLNMVCFEVIGNDFTTMMAAQAGQLELNVMMPVIAHDLTQSLLILTNGITVFTNRLVKASRQTRRDVEVVREERRHCLSAKPVHRLREGSRSGKGGAQERDLFARGGIGERPPLGGAVRGGSESTRHDDAGSSR